ncbi:MAG: hypothetical protein L3J05_01135, partial [Robiginitomaculum sp.]|nr:hypothetical protein [Robiginitomaculum sp.]
MTIFTKWVFLTVFLAGLLFAQGARAEDTSFEVVSNTGGCNTRIIITTGAKFEFSKNDVKVYLRIDTRTNQEYAVPKLAYK